MTGFTLPFCIFRQFNVFIRLSERFSSCRFRRQCVLLSDSQSRVAYHGTGANGAVGGAFSVKPAGRQRFNLENNLSFSVRLKSNKISKKNRNRTLQEGEEEEDDDDDDNDDLGKGDFADEIEPDPNLPKDYKDLVKSVQSFRYDVVMKAGLDVARNKVEDAFYGNQLRLNGEKLWKKSRAVISCYTPLLVVLPPRTIPKIPREKSNLCLWETMVLHIVYSPPYKVKVGDTLDFIVEQDKDADTVRVMRVIVKNVAEEKTATEKYKVLLRRWKSLKLPKQDVLK
ncbi:mitochondrial transcription rescue factor 1 isoform X1 [Ambystoma mexicanum]|uniref:mitochondrial transcription rescue factor 1 isoform X1 n=1 Tax=Ambystoma mexicanum TaxID=8296 RepID=UPI0037E86B33